jgi:hypothetical protein
LLLFAVSDRLQLVTELPLLATQSAHTLAGFFLRELDYPVVLAGFF